MPIHLPRDQVLANAEVLKRALGLRYPGVCRQVPGLRPLDGSTAQGSHICLRLLKLRVVRGGFSSRNLARFSDTHRAACPRDCFYDRWITWSMRTLSGHRDQPGFSAGNDLFFGWLHLYESSI
jgi:hypothetical protein